METVAQEARVRKSSGEGLVREDGSVHPGWRTTFASGLGMMFGPSPILLFTFGTFVAPLSQEFGWTVAAITAGAMIVNLLLVVCSMVQGFAVDLFGPRKLILASIPVFGLAVASMAWLTPNITSFYLALALAAVCAVGIWPVAYNKAIAGWFDERLGLTLGLGNAGIGLGAALLPAISAYVISNHGWRTAYVVLGIIAILIPWPSVFALLKDPPSAGTATRQAHVSAAAPGLSFAEARRTPAFFITLAGFLLLGTFSSSSVIHQMGILTDTGLTVAQATVMQSVLGVSLILGRVGSGWLLDRIQASSILVAMCLAAASALVLLYAGAPWGTAPLCAALIGLVIGAEFDVLGFLIARYFGQKSFGVLYATIFASFQLFASAAIPLVGLVKSKTGTYGPALATLAGLMVLAAFLFLRLGPYRYPTKQAMAHG